MKLNEAIEKLNPIQNIVNCESPTVLLYSEVVKLLEEIFETESEKELNKEKEI